MKTILCAALAMLLGASQAWAVDDALGPVANSAFLADNVKKPGTITRPSGLQYRVLRPGFGRRPAPGDGRTISADCEIAGTQFKEGERLWLSWAMANRDPQVFPDPNSVVLDRPGNRHSSFGLGIHRCIGSNLARMEMTVAIEEWLKRVPEFRLDPAGEVTWSEGTVRGPRQLPMLFGKAR